MVRSRWMRWLLLQSVFAVLLGGALYALRPKPEACLGIRGCDGYRRNLFQGVLPRASSVGH